MRSRPNEMLAFDRRTASIVWTASLVLAGLYVVFAIRWAIFLFFLGLVLAYMIAPLVRALLRRTAKRLSRSTATAIVFAGLALAVGTALAIAGPHLAEQSGRFAEQLPALLQQANVADRIPLPAWLAPYRARLVQFALEHLAGGGGAAAAPVAKSVGKFVLATGAGLVAAVLIPILAYLILAGGPVIRERLLEWTRRRRHARMWRDVADDLDVVLGGYIRALLMLAFATTVSYLLALSLFGLPYSLLLALTAGVLEFIPVLGPLAAAVLIVGVAALSGYDHLLWIVSFVVVYRIFQDYVLNPALMHKSIALPSLLVLFGLLAGEELAGIAGIFLSTPALAATLIFARRIEEESRHADAAGRPPR